MRYNHPIAFTIHQNFSATDAIISTRRVSEIIASKRILLSSSPLSVAALPGAAVSHMSRAKARQQSHHHLRPKWQSHCQLQLSAPASLANVPL